MVIYLRDVCFVGVIVDTIGVVMVVGVVGSSVGPGTNEIND